MQGKTLGCLRNACADFTRFIQGFNIGLGTNNRCAGCFKNCAPSTGLLGNTEMNHTPDGDKGFENYKEKPSHKSIVFFKMCQISLH